MSSDGTVSSFRAHTEGGDLALRPVYRVSAGRWDKLTPFQAASLPGPRHLLLDQDCVLAHEDEVTPLVSWRSREVGTAETPLRECPAGLREVLSGMRAEGARIYLYGSRLLGRESGRSDWDFVVAYEGNLASLLESRPAYSTETSSLARETISSIASSYELTARRVTRRADLLRVLGKGWCAMCASGGIIDFFLAGNGGRSIPEMRMDRRSLVNCSGRIDPSSGSSFEMPRKVCIRTSTGRLVNFHHASWLLCGLEQFAGSRVALRDVYAHGPSDVWLSPWISKFSFEA